MILSAKWENNDIDQKSVLIILKINKFQLYKIHLVLDNDDFDRRIEF